MQNLRFVGLDDTGRLLLRGDDEQDYTLDIDEQLLAAVQLEHGQELRRSTMEDLRPRDIQARVRSGVSPEEVAEQSGVPLERVQRYARPVLQEREHVADSARRVTVRVNGTEAALDDLVEARLADAGLTGSAGEREWDAWRREDGRWTVELRFTDDSGDRAARWCYDPNTRSVAVDDDTARAISEGSAVAVPSGPPLEAPAGSADPAAADGGTRSAPRRLLSVPDLAPEGAGEGYDESEIADELAALGLQPVETEDDAPAAGGNAGRDRMNDTLTLDLDGSDAPSRGARPAAAKSPSRPATPAEPEPATPQSGSAPAAATASGADADADAGPATEAEAAPKRKPAKKAAKRSKRASVPSWDDIVFGARKPE